MLERVTPGSSSKKGKRRSAKTGLPPGTLVYIGERKTDHVRLTLIQYREGMFTQQELKSIDQFLAIYTATESGVITWMDIGGLHDVQLIEQIGKAFELHPLLLEDIVNTEQRPKREDYGSVIYLVLKMLCLDDRRAGRAGESGSGRTTASLVPRKRHGRVGAGSGSPTHRQRPYSRRRDGLSALLPCRCRRR
jgi:hypothetical protein